MDDQGQMLDMVIDTVEVSKEETNTYRPLLLNTTRGTIACRYYHATGEGKAIIWVGETEGFDTPGNNLYPRLAAELQLKRISSLQINFRDPTDIIESVLDVLAGIAFLQRWGNEHIGLVGYSFGSTVIIQAAAATPSIKTIVALAPQSYDTEAVVYLRNCSKLFIHGTADEINPSVSSAYLHELATGVKKLSMFKNAGHSLQEVSREVYKEVRNWLLTRLRIIDI